MGKEGRPEQEGRRGFPGGFLLFLLAAVLIALFVQNFLTTKSANVSFSYQVQHLVNLQLIVPQESRMTALGDNLVTFSGKFRDKQTDEGKKRFKYLQLLDRQDKLRQTQDLLASDLKSQRAQVMQAADWFLHLAGLPLPQGGYVVATASAAGPDAGEPIVITGLSNKEVASLPALKRELASLGANASEAQVRQYGQRLSNLVQSFRSPVLGIGQESVKAQLKSLSKEVEGAIALEGGIDGALATYGRTIGALEKITSGLAGSQQGGPLGGLRSVRQYRESLKEYEASSLELEQISLQLDKAREGVADTVWYFNNQALATRALERQGNETLDYWFQQAKQEWDQFPANKGLVFRAVDQPRTLALERNFKSQEPAPNYFKYLPALLMVGLLGMLIYFMFARQMKGMGSGAMGFGKSPAKLLGKGVSTVTFKDVAGCDEAKEELSEIVDFLKSPGKFTALGGRIPKGVLCVGSPGTGKTLIAKAVAGEAGRPFFSISGSDFVEMFVGVGASRIRDLFAQAKKQAPCIIFIDEIDAVGRHRGGGYGGGHDEREQTLNQLLVEMDGFDTNEGVILIAATNRPDVLDKALLRPGRFDRRVMIDLPDVKGRYEILKVHARKIKIDPDVDLMAIARMTPGAAGADLANLLNEAALLAARKGRSAVTPEETREAADKVRFGKERRSLDIDESEKRTTAYHESGHAIVGYLVKHADPVDKVTIIPRGFSLGATHFLPKKNRLGYWRREVLDQLAVAMGGRVAEEVFVQDGSSGAKQDIAQATALARSMVCEWGMSEELGMVAYDDHNDGNFSGLPSFHEKSYSEATAQRIDQEVKRLIDEAYKKAYDIIASHKEQAELMTQMLMEFETLEAEDLKRIMEGTWSIDEKRERLKQIDERHKKPKRRRNRSETPEDPGTDIQPALTKDITP
ncbi:MAG: ATP-dependent zinc metalloprotease FtsH [Parachlamydiales bacterium]